MPPENAKKTSGFKTFPGVIEMEHWLKMGQDARITSTDFVLTSPMLTLTLEAYLEPCHTSKMELFGKMDV